METANTQVVQDAYAAFGRGDVAGVLATLDDNVEWQAVIGTEGAAPHAGLRRGKAEVGEFFRVLAGATEFHTFEPREFIAQGDQVAVVGHYSGRVKATGKHWDAGWVMIFTFRSGKIVRFREYCDSRQLANAFQ